MTPGDPQTTSAASFRAYLHEIGINLAAGNATEHTHRPALQTLVQALDAGVRAVNEPKRVACGAPDYIVSRGELPVGYIEAKDVGRSLDEIERDEQLTRYRESLSNLVLTDYLEFRWYRDGEKKAQARLAFVGDSGKVRSDRDGQAQVAAMFQAFLAQSPPIVAKPEELAKRMAALAQIIRDIIARALDQDASGASPLRDQLEGFRRVLIHDLNAEQFADMYAQTIAYGLFAARVNAPADERFSRRSATYDLPKTNPFLRQMFGHIAGPDLDERITWAVDDLAELLARARMDHVLEDFGKRTRQEDPVVHFYETFLKAYDPKMREARGVYYTPEPVVSYIVRSVDHILKTEFGLPDGLADNSMIEVPSPDGKGTRKVHKVQILDPACGTGTFLAQVIETIRDTVVTKHGAGMWPGYVHEHLLPRLYGFELLMAPYAIAHLKLGLRLKETGYDINQSERLQVYLTNTLEEAHERAHGQLSFFGSWLAEEADRASEVKRELPIMVVLGNPPYSGHSANSGEWIVDLLKGKSGDVGSPSYFEVDGEPLGERNPKWLHDDYVKFIRFAQWRLSRTRNGVLGYVTNNGYLDNPTFRGMRQSLISSFNRLYLLDLHGSAKKTEVADEGTPDENVFDIQQGVAIALMTVYADDSHAAVVQCADLLGRRSEKYNWLLDNDAGSTFWTETRLRPPFRVFRAQTGALADEYQGLWGLTDIFPLKVLGFQSHRDGFAISMQRSEIVDRLKALREWPEEQLRSSFQLRESGGWTLNAAKQRLKSMNDPEGSIIKCLYRPFDRRWCHFSNLFMDRPRRELLRHVAKAGNVCLAVGRQGLAVNDPQWNLSCISREPIDANLFRRGGATVFPLFVNQSSELLSVADPGSRVLNVAPAFVSQLDERIDRRATNTDGPEAIFSWIYGLLHAPGYRARYDEFLKIDFPRIPLPSDRDLFRELCGLGSRLVTLHLMEAADVATITTYPVPGDNRVEKVRYSEPGQGAEQGRVWINATQYFEGVPPEVWAFHVGGYQVCQKWLKDRRGRRLNYDDLTHYQYIVAALAETIALMREIDEVIEAHGGWPIK